MNADKIPDIIIGRLPIYLRALQRMAEKGIQTTSTVFNAEGSDVYLNATRELQTA